MKNAVSEHFDFLEEDRPLEKNLRHTVELIQRRAWLLFR
jgi:hypothetical protein